jgi:hypothetical protein
MLVPMLLYFFPLSKSPHMIFLLRRAYANVFENKKAGLNLNLFGALSGAFSSKSKKTTHKNADGSSEVMEEGHDQGAFWFL